MALVTLHPNKDVYISEYYPNCNFSRCGSPEALFISQFMGAGDDYRSLLKFDVCCLVPPTATIEYAKLILDTFRNDLTTGSITARIFRLLEDWNERTVTWNNQPNAATAAEDDVNISAGSLAPVKFDITELVRGWLNGSIPNNGVLVKGDECRNSVIGFRSTRFNDSDKWPRLKIKLVDGIIEIYPAETLAVPAKGIVTSCPISLDGKLQATFLVKNKGSADVNAMIEVSNDGSNWFLEGEPVCIPDDGFDQVALTTEAAVQYARLLVYTPSKCPSTVVVYPSTREN
ncbi:MAG: DNRLRE domain-containing protein [Syntrophomonadaceae bacterium]|nr:DNRLRE domain-containing protein [Syntrophomonadaceae bacterium]MDD4548327.1 DNRLRE domain-containing protein [Syntrophomonadaceae bacterium]